MNSRTLDEVKMKIIKKNVYYCDFCKKKSLNSLKKHELHCTNNPNRKCGLCKSAGIENDITEIMGVIKTKFAANIDAEPIWENNETKERLIGYRANISIFDDIKQTLDWCPACVLAILRQCKVYEFVSDKERKDTCLEHRSASEGKFYYRYDFQKDLKEYWGDLNAYRQDDY